MSFYCLMCKSFVRLAAELSFSLNVGVYVRVCVWECVYVCLRVYWCVNFHYIVKLLHIL